MDLSSDPGPATGLGAPQHWPSTVPTLGSDNAMTVADCWFAALDQRAFSAGNSCWTTRVMGVHLEGLHTWIQLEFAEHPGSSVVLHLTPWTGLHDAVDMIRAEIIDHGR